MLCRTTRFLLLTLLYPASLVAQEDALLERYDHPSLKNINALVESRQYRKAIDLSLSIADQMEKQSRWEGYIFMTLKAAEIETFEVWKGKGFAGVDLYPDYSRPLRYLQKLNTKTKHLIDRYPYLEANALFVSGVVYHWLAMPDTAQVLQHKALEMRRTVYGESSREVADSYQWLGILYGWGLHRRDLAVQYYRAALERQKKFMPRSRYALGSVYYGLANIAMKNYEFDEALAMANHYMSLYHDIPYEQAFGFQLIANIYWSEGDFQKSLEYRNRAVDVYRKSNFRDDLVIEYSNLSADLAILGRYAEAEKALRAGEEILNASDHRDPYYSKMLYANFGHLYHAMKEFDKADVYFKKALDIAINQYGQRNDEVANIYRMRGEMLKDQGLLQDAMADYDKMLIAVIPELSPAGPDEMPPLQHDSPYFRNIISAYFHKGDALLAWYHTTGDLRHLEKSIANYRHAYRQIMIARTSIGDELSKPFLLSNFRQSIENSMQCAHLLYRNTKSGDAIEDLFTFVEFNKYLNVLDALARAERAGNSGVPVELFFQLDRIGSELNRLQRIEFQHDHLALSADSIPKLRDNILALIDARKRVLSDIARYTGRTGAATEPIIPRISDVQQLLGEDEQILEYFWGRDSIYTISLTDKSAAIATVARDGQMDSLFAYVRAAVEGQPSFDVADIRRFSMHSSTLYRKLFEPVVEKEKIVVIPDGALNLVAVEALVTDHDPGDISFRDLRYAIHEREISYAYSSSILYQMKKKDGTTLKNVLAFSYTGGATQGATVHQQGVSLPGTVRELETLSKVFSNVARFTGDAATKANFLDNIRDRDIIHLGVHGVGDPDVADNARLVFMTDSSNIADLFAYEIYNLDIDADLVVLSACETGLGKQQAGEGILSIARAFTYAGCPSVVMSMWRVPDGHTASIMEGFYNALHDGNSFRASLRESKRSFLASADAYASHPAYWSAFVLNGRDQMFENNPAGTSLWLAIAALLLGILYLAAMKKLVRLPTQRRAP